jgi:signal peptidase I
LAVKRVAGLPGELIQVRAGDVYVDGKIQRKTLRQQRAVRVLVYDADFRPRLEPAPPARWYGRTEASGWERVGGRLAHDAGPADRPIDWLVYGHWRRGGRPGEVVATPITDVCGYNQDRPRREEAVRPVRDVMLSFRIADTLGRGLLWLWATDGWEQFAVRVDPQGGSYTVLHSVAARQGKGQGKGTVPFSSDENRDSPQVIAAGKLPSALNGMTLEVSLFDQQFLLAMNGRPVAVWPYDRPDGAPPPPAEPLAIGSQGLGVVLQSLRVWRDVYYASPLDEVAAANLEKGFRLGGDEYFVLGDNSPISEDSRTWPEARTVAANMLIGRPILVIFPVGEFAWGGQHIQVPELGQIRYIR